MPNAESPRPLPAPLAEWIAVQRWFPAKGRVPALSEIGRWSLPAGHGATAVDVLLVVDDASGAIHQVPLVTRPAGSTALEALAEDSTGVVVDGADDPAFAAALFELVARGGAALPGGVATEGEPASGAETVYDSSRVLSGEQSNTSIIVQTAEADGRPGAPVIVKLFRTLSPGDNPDVVLQTAIAAAGSDRVPRSIGAVRGQWTTPDGATAEGHLAFAQEFLSGTQDAWRVATAAVDADEDFSARARDLGRATAEVHSVLAGGLGAVEPDPARVSGLLASMRSRLQAATEVVPGLAERVGAIEAVFAAAASEPWPALQRVHGDYHLGQVLLVPDRGWVLLDFEGEPMRPMAERAEPDLALRDVAGMLRSFDYASGASRATHPGDEHAVRTASWAAAARRAFLEGYEERSGTSLDAHERLLAALELDKALYEAVYEARNRPDWLPIPASAIERLTGAGR